MIASMPCAEIEFTPDLFIALGTMILAVGTVALAFFTFRLASSASRDQRAEWRPVLIAAREEVGETTDGEFLIVVRNVGRGPALGVNGELRIAGPSGAVIPGQENVCLPGDTMPLRFGINGEYGRGIVRFEVTYYDIGEWWHRTDLTASISEENGPLTIGQTFVNEMNRQLLPVHGSRRAQEVAERKRNHLWHRTKRRLRHPLGGA